jgi:hypothetical protein
MPDACYWHCQRWATALFLLEHLHLQPRQRGDPFLQAPASVIGSPRGFYPFEMPSPEGFNKRCYFCMTPTAPRTKTPCWYSLMRMTMQARSHWLAWAYSDFARSCDQAQGLETPPVNAPWLRAVETNGCPKPPEPPSTIVAPGR